MRRGRNVRHCNVRHPDDAVHDGFDLLLRIVVSLGGYDGPGVLLRIDPHVHDERRVLWVHALHLGTLRVQGDGRNLPGQR